MNVKMALINITPTIANPRVSIPSPGCRDSDRMASPAPIHRRLARKCVNCLRNFMNKDVFSTSLISFEPNSINLFLASSSVRPVSDVTRVRKISSFVRLLIFMSWLEYYEVAGCLSEHILNRVTLQKRTQKAPLTGTHYYEVMSF